MQRAGHKSVGKIQSKPPRGPMDPPGLEDASGNRNYIQGQQILGTPGRGVREPPRSVSRLHEVVKVVKGVTVASRPPAKEGVP